MVAYFRDLFDLLLRFRAGVPAFGRYSSVCSFGYKLELNDQYLLAAIGDPGTFFRLALLSTSMKPEWISLREYMRSVL